MAARPFAPHQPQAPGARPIGDIHYLCYAGTDNKGNFKTGLSCLLDMRFNNKRYGNVFMAQAYDINIGFLRSTAYYNSGTEMVEVTDYVETPADLEIYKMTVFEEDECGKKGKGRHLASKKSSSNDRKKGSSARCKSTTSEWPLTSESSVAQSS
jgi:hypothetical protein